MVWRDSQDRDFFHFGFEFVAATRYTHIRHCFTMNADDLGDMFGEQTATLLKEMPLGGVDFVWLGLEFGEDEV